MDRFITKKPKLSNDGAASTSAQQPCEKDCQSNDIFSDDKKENAKRKFRPEWLETFDWLKEKDGSEFCFTCSKQLKSHLGHLKAHATCASHLQSYEAQKRQFTLEKFYSSEQMNRQQQVQHAEFVLVMFCITHNLPMLLMDYLPALLVECCPDSSIAKLVKCGRTKSMQVIDFIAKKGSEKVVTALKTKKFSLIVDETTDVSMVKSLVLVARFVDSARVVQDRFIALLELTKTDALSIFNVIKGFFATHMIPLNNLIGLATDGANVMAGDLGGLKALLSAETDFFYIKCTCHSLHLCSSYACKKLPADVETLCRNIYSFFSHSPKRINELKEFQDYCSVKPHKILGICKTRWLSLEGVVVRMVEQWDSLQLYFISHFLEVNGVQTKKLAEGMSPKMKCYFLFLSYILPIINNLNKEFQSESSRLPYLYSSIKANYLLILSNFIKKDKINNNIGIDYKNISHHREISNIFIGTKAEIFMKSKITQPEIVEVKTNALKFYVEFLNQINSRFDFKREEIKQLQIITPAKVLSQEDLSILPLILLYPNLVDSDPDLITTQWNLLRLSEVNLSSDLDINIFWEKVSSMKNGINEPGFRELASFVFNLITLPHSSAAAERKFSTLALIKTKLRNKLKMENINSIMQCKELINKDDPHYVWSAKDISL